MAKQITRRNFLKAAGVAGTGAMLASQLSPLSRIFASNSLRQKTSLTIPLWWAPHEIAGALATIEKGFTPNTGITVNFEFIGSDYFPKVFTNLVSGNPYDILTFNATDTPQFIDRNLLMPLDDLIARDSFDLSDFDPKALDQWTYDGKLYGLSNDMGSFHCYFNLDLFEKAGLTAPKATDEWTWDQLAEWAKALTIKDGDQVVQYGFAASDTHWCWEMWANLNGAKLFNDDFTTSNLADPKVIEAFEFYQKLMWDDQSAVRPGSVQSSTSDLFLAGQLGILLDGTWQVGYLRSKKDEIAFNWDVGLPPHNASATTYFIPNFTGGWTIPTVAQDPDASWKILQFYASKEWSDEVTFRAQSSMPTRKSALAGAGFDQWPENPPQSLTTEFYDKVISLGLSRQNIKHVLNSDAQDALSQLDLIYSNEQQPADLLPQVAESLTAALAST